MENKKNIEIDSKYIEHLELLKQIIPSSTGEKITDDGEMVEALIDSFMSFVEQQAGTEEKGGCCGGEGGCCSN